MGPALYNVIVRSAYDNDSREPCLRLYRCTFEEVCMLMDEIIWKHSGYMMEIYRYVEDDDEE